MMFLKSERCFSSVLHDLADELRRADVAVLLASALPAVVVLAAPLLRVDGAAVLVGVPGLDDLGNQLDQAHFQFLLLVATALHCNAKRILL